MKTTIINIIAIILSTFCVSSCKKANTLDNKVPATQIGANTFGCMINGQIVAVNHKKGFLTTGGVNATASSDEFGIWVVTDNPRRDITIGIRFNGQPGIFPIYIKEKNYVYLTDDVVANGTIIGGDNYYESSEKSVGTIQITRVDNAVLAGTFVLDLYNKTGQAIHLTDGRFDLALQ